MEQIEMIATQKVLAHCTVNEIEPKDFYVGFALIDIKSKNVELFGKEEADYINSLVSSKEIENNFSKVYQLDLINKLQKFNIYLIEEFFPFDERKQKLLDFSEICNRIEVVTKKIGIK